MEKLLQLLMITGGLGLSGLLTLPLFPYGKQENYSLALQNTRPHQREQGRIACHSERMQNLECRSGMDCTVHEEIKVGADYDAKNQGRYRC
ncbi:MAG: hypothetical protein NZ828_07135 [Alphaproteobacteria bacterium]|jgi:hypothetical protein|nr:hypothetical protein [Alphaproteobacteria bacterium]|tara:strand:+ start:124 stop:396 length:273 start_codon:yes stop_codon:yes gene_type:complete